LYATTLGPGIEYWDTGEMQTVPYILGIAHPTGFPLFILLGWCFSHVVVVGNVAWRLSLFSALASAAAAAVLCTFVRDITRSALVGLAAAFAFSVVDIVWLHAIRAEVHDLALACTALALVAAARAGANLSTRALMLAALGCGLGIATHPVVALAVPAAVAFAWPALRRAAWSERGTAALAIVVPLGLYAYIPIRSAYVEAHALEPLTRPGSVGDAFLDYGAPSTARAFWAYVTGADFHPGEAFASVARMTGAERAFALAHTVVYHEFSFVALAFALVGFGYLVATQRRMALGFGLLFFGALAFAPNYQAESDTARYALPALWALTACAAIGADWIAHTLIGERPGLASLLAAAALAAAALPNVASAFDDVTHARARDDAREIGPEVARRTADGSLVIAAWTYATPLAYEIYVERALGSRRLLSGWPNDFSESYAAWHARYKHIYFVVGTWYDFTGVARTIYVAGRWQLAELQ
jgi:hypothetical protein